MIRIIKVVTFFFVTSAAYAQDIDQAFVSYRIESKVADTLGTIRAREFENKIRSELLALDTLLPARNRASLVFHLQKFGHFNFLIFEKSIPHLIIDDRINGIYKGLKLPGLDGLQAQNKLKITFARVSPLQIPVLPDINSVPKNAQWNIVVAGIYLDAIKARIPRCNDFVTKNFTFENYLRMETKYEVDTPSERLQYRQTFLEFMFSKYKVR